ncbi:unnamed protein product [Cuscuta campestris]|uniref:Putative plant transposon protein domain-containing protein n=1 Tax=Cuscuta campestris TaxID=132261 RepID=A0A484LWQ4_9ASTE|nr:unnamed protein product [Cuscuta campestris]
MEEGASVSRPPLLRGHNYKFWKGRMRAFLKSQGGGVWRTVETGWTEPVKHSDDLSTTTVKKFEDYSRTEVLAAEHNDKALNAIFGAVDVTQYRLISNCVSAKEAWDILEVTHEGDEKVKTTKYQILMTQYENLRMDEKETIVEFHGRVCDLANQAARLQEPFPESKLVLKVLRSLPERFDLDVKAISQSHDAKKMTLDALMGNLETIELNMKEDSKRRKPEKQIAFLGTDLENDNEDVLAFDEEFQEQLSLFTKQFKKKTECANNLKKKRQAFSITCSDEDTDEDQGCEESNCAFISQSDSDNLVEQHMDLQEKWIELLMVNRRNTAEKNQLACDLKILKQNLEKAETDNADLKFELQKLKDYIKWMKIAGAEVLDAQEIMFKAPGDRQGIGSHPLLSDDDGLYLLILQPSEVLRLEYTPINLEESTKNPNTKGGICEEEVLGEILEEEEPIVACLAVPFQDSACNTKGGDTKRRSDTGPTRWSLRQTRSLYHTENSQEEKTEVKESEKREKKMKPQSEPKKRKESEICPSPKLPVKRRKSTPDAPPSSRRETRSSKNSPSSCTPGKQSVKLFPSSVATSLFLDIVKKSIIPQRNLDVSDLRKKTNLLPTLRSNKLLKSVTLPGSYVKKVIQEFYCNLTESCVTEDDTSYQKVFVRGKLYDFSPSVINSFLGTDPNPVITPIDEETVWRDLTNGLKDYQHRKSKVPSSVLKSSYALLLRIAAFHWMPTTHTNNVPLCIATLIYRIKNNVPFDLGRVVFDQVMAFAAEKYKKNKNGLPYPLLVYSILKDQGFEKTEDEEEEIIPPLLQVDARHLEGSHFNDMAAAGTSSAETPNLASVDYQLSFLEKEIKSLQMDADYHHEIAKRSTERMNVLIQIAHNLRQTKSAQSKGERLAKQKAVAGHSCTDEDVQEDSAEEISSSESAGATQESSEDASSEE